MGITVGLFVLGAMSYLAFGTYMVNRTFKKKD
jgi:hypothetical protein